MSWDTATSMVMGPLMSGRRLLVAVSGGIDSVTLLHFLSGLRERAQLELCVGHVHHGLRGSESDGDQDLVEALAAERGLIFHAARVDPGELRIDVSQREKPSPQEAARRVRYEALHALQARVGADAVVTAHTLDDQAETVLMRLLRGTSPDGLGGMAPASDDGRRLRPLLAVTRNEVAALARDASLRWREDSSNANDQYARNRLRRHWLPGLSRDFNPRLQSAIARLSEAQRADSDWLGQIIDELAPSWLQFTEDGVSLRLLGWRTLPRAAAARLVERAMISVGGGRDLSRKHIERVLAFLEEPHRHEGGRTLELPGGLRLVRESKAYWLRRSA